MAERKARDHELYRVAGLLTLAGLADRTTGQPTWDRGELLGALLDLAQSRPPAEKRALWKRRGDALMAGQNGDPVPSRNSAQAGG